MSIKNVWDRIRSIVSGATNFLISDEQREEAAERLRKREEWEHKRSTPRRLRHAYRIPPALFERTHYRHRIATDDTGRLPRQAPTYRAARRNAERTGKAGGMGNQLQRGRY